MTNKNEPIDMANEMERNASFDEDAQHHIFELIDAAIEYFTDHSHYPLTAAERRRLISSGIRNYGFLDKARDLAAANPDYHPPKFDIRRFEELGDDLEFTRNLLVRVQAFERTISNSLLVYGDAAFRMALSFYNTVRELSRTGDEQALALFNILRPYFRRQRISDSPTDAEVETDVNALLHGRKDGKIVIEHEAPHLTGGKHEVIDETHKAKAAWKETESGEIES